MQRNGFLLLSRLVSLLLGLTFLTGLFINTSLLASAHSSVASTTHSANADTGPCNPSSGDVCIAPQPQNICSGQQWYSGTSHDGHNIGWTYTNGSTHCLTVSWSLAAAAPASSTGSCGASIYIPWGHGTATLTYHIGDPKNASITNDVTINQNNYGNGAGEFVPLAAVSVNQTIWLEDDSNPGGSYHASQIAWGMDQNYSLKLDCSS